MTKKETAGKDESTKLTFSKSQLVKSQKYHQKHDALNALLNDDKTYSISEVDDILKRFYEGGNK